MVTVWAHQEGLFTDDPGSGWSHTIQFGVFTSEREQELFRAGSIDPGTADLVEKLEAKGLASRVERLAIVAHGIPGAVFMTGKTMPPASPGSLARLGKYLVRTGMLTFASCNAGEGPNGSQFLIALSRHLPQRVVVGYSISGFFQHFKNTPGNVLEAKSGNRPPPGTAKLTPWSNYAKWAYDGIIVREPSNERAWFHNKHCANPHCPGHKSELDRCPYKTWGHEDTLLKYEP
jgi:hypothetical protein